MLKEISIHQYLAAKDKHLVIDVRSPKEFAHAHIPEAVNVPLFDDAERAVVGIAYKHEGRDIAIEKGLEIVGPKIAGFVKQAKQIVSDSGKSLVLHCWRGGMRSKSMATLFDFAGIKTEVIRGGYKSYRRAARTFFDEPLPLVVLGGKTGSAKTKILQELNKQGEQIIDLEKMANHKGSAFGRLGEEPQPSTEMFENLLFDALLKLDKQKHIWIENESQLIGEVFIPDKFWHQMRSAPVLSIEFPLEQRITFLIKHYSGYAAQDIENALLRIRKKLGGQHYKYALECYRSGNLEDAVRTALVYYDKTYAYGMQQRDAKDISVLEMDTIDPENNARTIVQWMKNMRNSTAIKQNITV